ncbi:STAS domain-containing protein [Actinoplanes rectilineatus]|uniref:STAS domain-containing protein n=1 Tax=Actinoplanes rectilineatus TaxID=113571 RepID=UPI0005F2D72D|nr:STAS domain-containing protein [Actinoplanes rectilineatus]
MTDPIADVTTSIHETGVHVRVTGELDMSNAGTVGDRIRAAGTSTPVDLDLSDIEFLDSSALHMLQQLSAAFDRDGGRLTVAVAPGSIVERLLTITHMDAYLNIRESQPGT